MLGRCLTSTVWGIAADRFGRKPVAILGVFSVLVKEIASTTIDQSVILSIPILFYFSFLYCDPLTKFLLIFRVIFNTLFGLSTSYWMAIATRFLLGALNGLLGPIKVL